MFFNTNLPTLYNLPAPLRLQNTAHPDPFDDLPSRTIDTKAGRFYFPFRQHKRTQ